MDRYRQIKYTLVTMLRVYYYRYSDNGNVTIHTKKVERTIIFTETKENKRQKQTKQKCVTCFGDKNGICINDESVYFRIDSILYTHQYAWFKTIAICVLIYCKIMLLDPISIQVMDRSVTISYSLIHHKVSFLPLELTLYFWHPHYSILLLSNLLLHWVHSPWEHSHGW